MLLYCTASVGKALDTLGSLRVSRKDGFRGRSTMATRRYTGMTGVIPDAFVADVPSWKIMASNLSGWPCSPFSRTRVDEVPADGCRACGRDPLVQCALREGWRYLAHGFCYLVHKHVRLLHLQLKCNLPYK
jgi:hypothetical protein